LINIDEARPHVKYIVSKLRGNVNTYFTESQYKQIFKEFENFD
jgi:hypothetical protein